MTMSGLIAAFMTSGSGTVGAASVAISPSRAWTVTRDCHARNTYKQSENRGQAGILPVEAKTKHGDKIWKIERLCITGRSTMSCCVWFGHVACMGM